MMPLCQPPNMMPGSLLAFPEGQKSGAFILFIFFNAGLQGPRSRPHQLTLAYVRTTMHCVRSGLRLASVTGTGE